MFQSGLSGEVILKNLEKDNSTTATLSENIFFTPQNSQDQLSEIQEIMVSAAANFPIKEIQDLEIFKSASNSNSNFPTFLNNELNKWTVGIKEEAQVSKALAEEFKGVKISEISSENDIATNTHVTQNQSLKAKTIPASQTQKDSACCSLSSENLVRFLKTEILKNIPSIKNKLNSDATSVDKSRHSHYRKWSIPKTKIQKNSLYLRNPLNKKASEKIALKCMSTREKIQKSQEKIRELPAEMEKVKGKFSKNQHRSSACKVPLKCRSWNASNECAVSEFSSKLKPSTGPRSETWSLEHTCNSTPETSSIFSKIHQDSLTISKMGKPQEVSKCCRSKNTPRTSENDSSIDPKSQDVEREQNEDFFDCQSTFSLQQQSSTNDKLESQRPSESSSSSSKSRSRSEDQSFSLDTSKVSKLSDGSASKSINWSSSSNSELRLLEKNDASQINPASSPVHDDNMPPWSMMQFCKIPSPDSSIEFLQDKISSLLNDDQHMDMVMEITKLAERNLDLQDEIFEKETKIGKLAQRSESVIERCEEIEVGLVSNLVITDDRISKLSRVIKIAKGFQMENNALWNQIEKLRDMLSAKDRKISRLLLLKSNDVRRDEIKFLKEKLNHLETENAALSANLTKRENMCKQYEKDLEGLEKNLRRAEDKLRLTFVNLKGIVRTQAARRKPQDSGNLVQKEVENHIISKPDKKTAKENTKKDAKESVSEAKAENASPTKVNDSLDKPSERIDKSEAQTGHNRKRSKSPYRKISHEVNGSSEVKRSQGV